MLSFCKVETIRSMILVTNLGNR